MMKDFRRQKKNQKQFGKADNRQEIEKDMMKSVLELNPRPEMTGKTDKI